MSFIFIPASMEPITNIDSGVVKEAIKWVDLDKTSGNFGGIRKIISPINIDIVPGLRMIFLIFGLLLPESKICPKVHKNILKGIIYAEASKMPNFP